VEAGEHYSRRLLENKGKELGKKEGFLKRFSTLLTLKAINLKTN
jgi:hypothetical protein